MPELPEVETIRLGLMALLISKVIESIRSDNFKSFPNQPDDVQKYIVGASVQQVSRRAKLLIINLSSGYSLVIHLKMTGQLVYLDNGERFGGGHPSASLISRLPDSSTRVIVSFSDKSVLFFNDQRKFGWMKLAQTSMLGPMFTNSYGPEPLTKDFNWQLLKDRLSLRPRSAIKAVLLDQKILAGVGNIYADESLWAAKIHPLQPTGSLTDSQVKRLCQALVDVLKLSIKMGGSSDRNYVNVRGQKGSYIKIAKVFRRQGQKCPRCDHLIIKVRAANRGTHYCPNCQKLKVAKITPW